jgi:hypothetical protein
VPEKSNTTSRLPTEDVSNLQQQDVAIPKFDLAEEILAEQRKISGVKRKAPGKKAESPAGRKEAESNGFSIRQSPHILSEEEQIIAEIVARDIQSLCRRTTSIQTANP